MTEATTIEKTENATPTSNADVQPKVEKPKASKTKRVLKPLQPKIETSSDGKVKKFTKMVDENRMQSVFTFKKNEDASNDTAIDVIFDYAGCSRDQLLQLATSSCRITLQQRLRKMSDDAVMTFAAKQQTVDVVTDLLASARVQRDPMDKLIADFARQSGITEAAARPKVEAMLREMRK